MPVDSLIGPTSPPSPKQRLSPTIYPKHTFFTFRCLHPHHFHDLPPKGAFYFYYKILILFDDRHLTVPLPLISLSLCLLLLHFPLLWRWGDRYYARHDREFWSGGACSWVGVFLWASLCMYSKWAHRRNVPEATKAIIWQLTWDKSSLAVVGVMALVT